MFNERLDRLIYDIIDETLPDIEQRSMNKRNQYISEFIMRARSSGMVSGIDIIQRIIEIVDDSIEIKVINGSGSVVENDDIIAIFRGNTNILLQLIKPMRTIVENLSPIATIAYRYRSNLQDSNIQIYVHKNFTPLFQPFEQYSFEQAGGLLLEERFVNLELLSQFHIPVGTSLNEAFVLIKEDVDQPTVIGIKVNSYEEYNAAITAECDMIVLCDFTRDLLATCFQTDTPEYIRIIQGNYDISDLPFINQLHPDGILIDRIEDIKMPFHVAIEQTR